MLRILLADDHLLFREGVESILNKQVDLSVVGSAASVHETVAKVCELKPDLVLMNFILPDGCGLDATQCILEAGPDVVIIFLAIQDEDERLSAAMREGAHGYLLKSSSITDLLVSIRSVARQKAAVSSRATTRLLEQFSQMQIAPKFLPRHRRRTPVKGAEKVKRGEND